MPEWEPILVTVDAALFTIRDGKLHVYLSRREAAPYKDAWALPGGFIRADTDSDAAATTRRVLEEKTGIVPSYLEQLYSFSGRVRDPRGWSVSVAYYALVPEEQLAPERPPQEGQESDLVAVNAVPDLPFDHNRIIDVALERLRGKASYSSLPAFLLPPSFTMQQLHEIYQQVLGVPLNRSAFRRKIEEQGVVVPAEGQKRGGAHRPAQLYRLSEANLTAFQRTI